MVSLSPTMRRLNMLPRLSRPVSEAEACPIFMSWDMPLDSSALILSFWAPSTSHCPHSSSVCSCLLGLPCVWPCRKRCTSELRLSLQLIVIKFISSLFLTENSLRLWRMARYLVKERNGITFPVSAVEGSPQRKCQLSLRLCLWKILVQQL